MTPTASPTPPNGSWKVIQGLLPVFVAILLPGVGFLTSEVIAHGESVAVLKTTMMTNEDVHTVVSDHAAKSAHPTAATHEELNLALGSVEAQQAIRYEQTVRELTEIKEDVRAIRDAMVNQ